MFSGGGIRGKGMGAKDVVVRVVCVTLYHISVISGIE
jgi:hypothetical protein